VRREDQLQQPAPEVGAVDALARVGEQELLDHVADVVVVIGHGAAPSPVDVEGVVEVHVALTRVWVPSTSRGVPLGAHSDWLVSRTSGWPLESTRRLPVSHWADTHGPLPPG